MIRTTWSWGNFVFTFPVMNSQTSLMVNIKPKMNLGSSICFGCLFWLQHHIWNPTESLTSNQSSFTEASLLTLPRAPSLLRGDCRLLRVSLSLPFAPETSCQVSRSGSSRGAGGLVCPASSAVKSRICSRLTLHLRLPEPIEGRCCAKLLSCPSGRTPAPAPERAAASWTGLGGAGLCLGRPPLSAQETLPSGQATLNTLCTVWFNSYHVPWRRVFPNDRWEN